MINELWPRWIEASIVKYLTTNFAAMGIACETSLESLDEQRPRKFVQIVLDGPDFRKLSPTTYDVFVELTLLIEYEVTTDLYETATVVGKCLTLLESIPVFNYGQSGLIQLGCLTPVYDPVARDWSGRDNGVTNELSMHQRSIETSLTMELANG